MKSGIEICAMQVMKTGKRHLIEDIELPNYNSRRKRNLQIQGNIES